MRAPGVYQPVVLVVAGVLLAIMPSLALALEDEDGDLVADRDDNCKFDGNLDQADVDRDGFGNACDADCTGDAVVGGADFTLLSAEFGNDCILDPNLSCDCDFDGDGARGWVGSHPHLVPLRGRSRCDGG